MDEQLKSNLTSSKIWVRILYMLFIAFCVYVSSFVVFFVVVIQCVTTLLTGSNNVKLRRFSRSLVNYIQDGLSFLTFNSEEKPFPFSDWPVSELEEVVASNPEPDDLEAEKDETEVEKTAVAPTQQLDATEAEKSSSVSDVIENTEVIVDVKDTIDNDDVIKSDEDDSVKDEPIDPPIIEAEADLNDGSEQNGKNPNK